MLDSTSGVSCIFSWEGCSIYFTLPKRKNIHPTPTGQKNPEANSKGGRRNPVFLEKTFRLGAILQEVVRQKNSFGVCVCVWQGGGGGGAFCKGAITQRIERYNSVIAMRLFTTPIKPPPETTYFFHSAGGFTLTSPTPGLFHIIIALRTICSIPASVHQYRIFTWRILEQHSPPSRRSD